MANDKSKDADYKQCSEKKLNRQVESILEVLKFVKEMCMSLFFTFLSYFNHYFNNSTKLKMSPNVIMSDVELNKLVVNGQKKRLTSCLHNNENPNDLNTPNFRSNSLRDITNFRTLFWHLRATAGTYITADQVLENINRKKVFALHTELYKLRVDGFKTLNVMDIIIRDEIVMFQNKILRYFDIHSRFKILFSKQAQTIEELKILNKNLKFLAEEVSEQMGEICELLQSIPDCILIYKYLSTLISEAFEEFLKEDFRDIFK